MTQVMKWFYLVDMAVWLGSLVFFSFVVAPTVHRTLKTEDAAALIRRIFPKYYFVGMVCAGVGIVLVGLLVADQAFAKWPGALSLLLLAALGATNAGLWFFLLPQMNKLRERKQLSAEAEADWKTLHRLSVQLNVAVLVGVLALLFLVVFARVA